MKVLAAILIALSTASSGSAPADAYFGNFKMSALRIRYETAQVKAHYETHKLYPNDALHLALLTEQSFDDWRTRYPHDTWLASTAYNLATLYAELPGPVAAGHAKALYEYVVKSFGSTSYATKSRAILHNGVPVRPQPAWANVPTPAPSPSTPASPGASPSPAASASPTASAAPSPTPSARASPTT